MVHILGVYYAPEHSRDSDRDYISRLQPPVIRILDADVQHIHDMHALAPNAIIAPRIWVIDDHDGNAVRSLMSDPVATGRDHAQQYRALLDRWKREAAERGLRLPPDSQIMFNAANEPNQGGTPDKIAAYNIAFLNRCTELKIRAAAVCLGVGWPDNTGPDTPVNWNPYKGIVEPIKRGNHVLELHEYHYKTGPKDGWGWLAGRHLQCPFDVPILLGEIGVDNYVDAARWNREGGNRGWVGHMSPDSYSAMLRDHIRGSDTRVIAALPFITDYRSNSWESFDTGSAHQPLLERKDQMVPQVKFQSSTPTVPPIVVEPVPPVEPIGEIPDARWIVRMFSRMTTVEEKVTQAVLNIESGSAGFVNNRLKIRFEAHIFEQYLGNDQLFRNYFSYGSPKWTNQQYKDNDGTWKNIHQDQNSVWRAFEIAQQLNRNGAFNSISMGIPQIMGFNYEKIGYLSAESMFNSFANSKEGLFNQYIAFFTFVLNNSTLVKAMKDKNWNVIASIYNGTGQVAVYSELLRKEYERLKG